MPFYFDFLKKYAYFAENIISQKYAEIKEIIFSLYI